MRVEHGRTIVCQWRREGKAASERSPPMISLMRITSVRRIRCQKFRATLQQTAADFAAVLQRNISEISNEISCFITPTVLNVAAFSSENGMCVHLNGLNGRSKTF